MAYLYKDRSFMDESDLRQAGFSRVAGVDEAGRGCLFAEVVVSCVMLSANHGIEGLKDSKKLTPAKRSLLYDKILERSLSISIVSSSAEEIDKDNIYQATKKCVVASIYNMKVNPDIVVIDGLFDLDSLGIPYMAVPGADGAEIYGVVDGNRKAVAHHYENVAAASIIAKVFRDRLMDEYDRMWPEYGFSKNKGYGTEDHIKAIKEFGITRLHRKTFKGCIGCSVRH